jgi:YegS/Rv2252/BmrU family lipid kinase
VSRRLALLVNPVSAGGKALKALPAVTAELQRLGAPHRVVTTRSSEHATEEAARAAQAGETVAALGGDGLLRPIAEALSGGQSAVAVIPCGRGNDLARVLEIPSDPVAAARLAVEGEERVIDLGDVDGKPFLGIASLGFDSDANRIANEAKLIRGNAVYVYAALRALTSWKPARFTVTLGEERHQLTGFSVAIGNSRCYGGGMMLLPHAELDDGQLDVLMVDGDSKLEYLRGVAKVFKGAHLDSPRITLARGDTVHVDSDRPFTVYADGDPLTELPATVRLLPRALAVIVPGDG